MGQYESKTGRWHPCAETFKGFTLGKKISQRCLMLCNKLPHNLEA